MLLTFIVLYLIITLLIGWLASKKVKNAQDFAIAGRKMPLFVVASGLFATWFGSETVMGASTEFVNHGILGIIEDPLGAGLCLILVGVFFARPLYRMNILTFSDYFRIRFDKKAEFVSAILMIPSYFGWIAAQLIAMAIILNTVVGLPIFWGIMICMLVVVFYTYIGGMWAVSITDTIQTVMIVLGMFILSITLFIKVGGLQGIDQHTPKGFFNILPKKSWINYVSYFAAWITVGFGSIPQQDVFQRLLSAKTERIAVRGAYLSGILYWSVAAMPLMIGLCGKILHPEIMQGNTQMAIPLMVLKYSSIPIQILFFGALLSAILSTCSGAILAPATVIAENLIKPLYQEKISDKKLLQAMRSSVVGIAVISAFMATQNNNIFELVSESSALSLVSLFVPLVAGLYWKQASALGAILSMLFGMTAWLYFQIMGCFLPTLIPGLLASISGMVLGTVLRK